MANGNWNDILAEYKMAREVYDGTMPLAKDFVWMEKLIPHLLSNRDLSELYPITSLHVLTLSFGEKWEDHFDKPYISIKLNWTTKNEFQEKYRFEFSLTRQHHEKEIYREFVEHVYCSFEKSLEIFDEMFEKLKTATK